MFAKLNSLNALCKISLSSKIMETSSRRSSGPVLPVRSGFQQRTMTSGASPFTSPPSSVTSSSRHSSSSGFFNQRRSKSPTLVKFRSLSPPPSTPSVRFSTDRSTSPRRSIAAAPRSQVVQRRNGNIKKRTCLCSPTTHPGSFRCALHKNLPAGGEIKQCSPSRLNMRRLAMTNSLVRIVTVEGDWVKRALAALIHPSSHQLRRREAFQARPSRFSIMSKAEDL